YKTDLHFKYSTPVACFIFSFVGFIFSVFSPRKETFMGMLYAIILVLIYYILISIFKSLGKQGIIPYPLISAWTTNVIFLCFGIYIFYKVRR
ncbi:LptF/LptG family permease, partial [bacterium]|nr:LptF/LptG family permease [bacterium]